MFIITWKDQAKFVMPALQKMHMLKKLEGRIGVYLAEYSLSEYLNHLGPQFLFETPPALIYNLPFIGFTNWEMED